MTAQKTTGENLVKYGIKNVHYAKREIGPEGAVTFATPVPWPGAKALSLEVLGEIVKFYADDVVFFQTTSNGGYEGEIEMTNVPDQMRIDIFGEELDEKGVLIENTGNKTASVALLFEIEGDKKCSRFCYYNVSLSKPNVETESVEEEVEPVTDKLKLTASPDKDNNIRAKTTVGTDEVTFNNWFKEVYKKAVPGA